MHEELKRGKIISDQYDLPLALNVHLRSSRAHLAVDNAEVVSGIIYAVERRESAHGQPRYC